MDNQRASPAAWPVTRLIEADARRSGLTVDLTSRREAVATQMAISGIPCQAEAKQCRGRPPSLLTSQCHVKAARDQKRSEAIRSDQKRSEAIRSHKKPPLTSQRHVRQHARSPSEMRSGMKTKLGNASSSEMYLRADQRR